MNKIFNTEKILTSIDSQSDEFVEVNWFGNETIYIRKILSLKDMTDLVRNMLKACETKTTGVFAPELIDFSFRLYIVTAYTLVDIPNNIEEQYKLLYLTDLFETTINNINQSQYQAIVRSVNLYVGFNLF